LTEIRPVLKIEGGDIAFPRSVVLLMNWGPNSVWLARWFLDHAAIYLVASLAVGLLFFLGVGFYSLIWPALPPVGNSRGFGMIWPLATVMLGIFCSVLASELLSHHRALSRKLIDAAAMRLSDDVRERYREEWLAHLNDEVGLTASLLFASGLYFDAGAIEKARRDHQRRKV
jgi:hypothetical protein